MKDHRVYQKHLSRSGYKSMKFETDGIYAKPTGRYFNIIESGREINAILLTVVGDG